MGLLGLRPLTKEGEMYDDTMEKQRTSAAVEELRRLGGIIESLEQRGEQLARMLESVMEPDHPRPSGNGAMESADRVESSPLVNEMRHHVGRLQRLEAHLANLSARLTV